MGIHELCHRADAAMLQAVANAAARGALVIPIAETLLLEQVGAVRGSGGR